jgi:hypothetical protein
MAGEISGLAWNADRVVAQSIFFKAAESVICDQFRVNYSFFFFFDFLNQACG